MVFCPSLFVLFTTPASVRLRSSNPLALFVPLRVTLTVPIID